MNQINLPIVDAYHQVDIRVAPVEVLQVWHDDEVCNATRHIDTQTPLWPFYGIRQAGLCVFDQLQYFPALRQILCALRGQADPTRCSVQQAYLQVLLKIFNAAGNCGGRQRERLRRLDKASCFSHTYENLHRLNTVHDC
ncbi:hypothetical protein BK649_20755 [Pseudomonas canadensis]|uniref:Uncharacterized protein n=1 Tax=Pseudomonas canadensis TaxID=915099 RepID=A0A423F205_9PSED|nr:hypothetical protein BB029_13305 [Pseudomonas sp. S3E12]PIB39710.1 hypothetical protein AOA57_30395 [Pseudomonas sp. 2588-5]ROM48336.1 hypothetical protein BK649_20755 [Pseudomonas canadensis]